jgi:hypothetical protein
MNDLEWYLDVGGKQSGPHTAKEIVELVRAGKIPASAHVTAARMSGDWVSAQDLVDAYSELYAKKTVPSPIDGASPFTPIGTPMGSGDPNFQAPPRPTEQLEASKIIYLNREPSDQTPDPTDALFHAIQAVREKAAQKTTPAPGAAPATGPTPSAPGGSREAWSGNSGANARRVSPQFVLIGTLALIFGLTVYGITYLLSGKDESIETAKSTATPPRPTPESSPPATTGNPTGRLLNEGGGGISAARGNLPAARPAPGRPITPPAERLDPEGGARYRDDRDQPADRANPALGSGIPVQPSRDEGEVDQAEEPAGGPLAQPIPVDPSQVSRDRVIPENDGGTIPNDSSSDP